MFLYHIFLNIILFLVFTNNAKTQSPKTITLLVGLSTINTTNYATKYEKEYSNYATSGVVNDISNFSIIAEINSHDLIILMDERADRHNILKVIDSIGNVIQDGDYFIFYFSGHGDLMKDLNNDEESGYDQVLVAYDDYIIDDEIFERLNRYFVESNNIMIVDACHSSTSYKSAFGSLMNNLESVNSFNIIEMLSSNYNFSFLCDFYSPEFPQENHFPLIYYGATPDLEFAFGNEDGGLLSYYLYEIFSDASGIGNWNQYSYRRLACELYDRMLLHKQVLQYHELGDKVNLYNNNTPFKSY